MGPLGFVTHIQIQVWSIAGLFLDVGYNYTLIVQYKLYWTINGHTVLLIIYSWLSFRVEILMCVSETTARIWN